MDLNRSVNLIYFTTISPQKEHKTCNKKKYLVYMLCLRTVLDTDIVGHTNWRSRVRVLYLYVA